MIVITYKDSYKQERHLSYDTLEDFNRAFLGCLTVPDYLKVEKLTINGKDTNYTGTLGDLYRDVNAMDLSTYL